MHARLRRLQQSHGNRHVQRMLARAGGRDHTPEVTEAVESSIERARGAGSPLEHGVRQQMEAAFGASFDGVRVHTDAGAHALNRAVDATAFTVGRDIFFSGGAYQPGNFAGRELLAHELTHVVQQGGGGTGAGVARTALRRACSQCDEEQKLGRAAAPHVARMAVSSPHDPEELEAVHTARRVANAIETAASDALAPLGEEAEGELGDGLDCRAGDQPAPVGPAPAPAPAAPVAACATPINFALGAATDSGANAIFIPLSWASSTGNLADLSNCTIREVVNYDPIPNPPFTWTPPNPTILSVAATLGVAGDTHSYPPGLSTGITTPRQSGTMTAHQVYQYRCTAPGCSGNWTNFPGQAYTIVREVFPQYVRPNPWRYSITKTGVGNPFSGSREVEVP